MVRLDTLPPVTLSIQARNPSYTFFVYLFVYVYFSLNTLFFSLRFKVGKRCHSGAMLDLVDASSLLYRLQMEGWYYCGTLTAMAITAKT